MQRIMWYALLAVVALGASIAGRAQAPQAPQAKVRELATIDGDVSGWVRLPSRRTLIYSSVADGGHVTFAYDIATKRRTLLGTNMYPTSVSPLGDRLAFDRFSEDRTGNFVWTIPIDPKTGIAAGQAQRVSLRPRRSRAIFSPDGKMLVFQAGPRADGTGTGDVTVVPTTGGAERVVANYQQVAVAWSADGKSLYLERSSNPQAAIERVPVAGGPSEPLVPRTGITNKMAMGLSPDARAAFFQFGVPANRFSYRTAAGVEGEISVPLPPLDNARGLAFTVDSTLRYAMMTQVWNQRVRVHDLTTGQARDLLPGNVQSRTPAWSPDGRRLAVLSGNRSRHDITVVNADGSSPRRYPVPMHLDGWEQGPGIRAMPWSPDGRFLAFRARAASKDHRKVGSSPDDQRQMALLDVNSGQTRVLSTSSSPIVLFVWRSDGNAIRALKQTLGPTASPSRWSIVEIPLNGPERLLRDISAEFPRAAIMPLFASDREAVVASGQNLDLVEVFLVPLDGGAARRLPDPGIEPGSRPFGVFVAGNRLMVGLADARGVRSEVKIVSTVGDSTRTLRLPFSGANGVVLPDGEQLVAVSKATGDSVFKLFLVPLDGSATRLLGEIPRGDGGFMAPSPDGKLLAYTSDGIYTSKIHEIDFGPALQTIMKR